MPKPRNEIPSKVLHVTINAVLYDHLSSLVGSGLFGNNPSEAAGRLIERGVEACFPPGALLSGLGSKAVSERRDTPPVRPRATG